ncbi:MAG: serine/threonine-protein kinase, partial [Acidobacteriota bacterium]
MSAASWEDIERLFDRAVRLPEAERDVWLAEQDSAPEVLDTVRRLVAADGGAEDRFLQPIVDPTKASQRRAGPYALLEELGRGGMGVVYRAVRADGAFDDEVAVKVLAAGPAGSDRQLRFLKERQILASVRHPNIAYLLDGGWTEDQRPFLVMEWVRGRPIDAYCEDRRLTVRERIRLVLQVAGALEHAHRNLVVHRDVKPSNVLVIEPGELASGTGQSTEGMVKLLDFGIARLIADDHESQTRTGQKLMTLAYASPEQIQGEVVTTASDVYQLGLLLYLLITGTLPYRVDVDAPLSLARAVVEQEPIAASRILSRKPGAAFASEASTDLVGTPSGHPGDAKVADRRPAPSGRYASPVFDDEPCSRGEQRDLDAILL